MEEKIQKKEESKDLETAFIQKFGFDKVMQLDKETNGIFSTKFHKDKDLEVMAMALFAKQYHDTKELYLQKESKDPATYEDFKQRVYEYLVQMKNKGIFRNKNIVGDLGDYDYIQGKFREEHPEIFINEDLEPELKRKYYQGLITAEDINKNPDLYEVLKEKRVDDIFKARMKKAYLLKEISQPDFVKLCREYGKYLDNEKVIEKINNLKYKDSKLDIVRKSINEEIYNLIKDDEIEYNEDLPKSFKNQYTELFLPENISEELRKKFIKGKLVFEDIRQNPELAEILVAKDLDIGFRRIREEKLKLKLYRDNKDDKRGHLEENWGVFKKEKILELAKEFGQYLEIIDYDIFEGSQNFESKKATIEKEIEKAIMTKVIKYGDDVPEFFKKKYPQLMLQKYSPQELKDSFYDGYKMDFNTIKQHQNWIPFLLDKDLTRAFPEKYKTLISIFENEHLMKLGIRKLKTVDKMVEANAEETLKIWYRATGGKFIPDATVMLNVPESEMDRFLSNSIKWLVAKDEINKTPKEKKVEKIKDSYAIKKVEEAENVKYSQEDYDSFQKLIAKWEQDEIVEDAPEYIAPIIEEEPVVIQPENEIEQEENIEEPNINTIELEPEPELVEPEDKQEEIPQLEPEPELIEPENKQEEIPQLEPEPELIEPEDEITQIEPVFEEPVSSPIEEQPEQQQSDFIPLSEFIKRIKNEESKKEQLQYRSLRERANEEQNNQEYKSLRERMKEQNNQEYKSMQERQEEVPVYDKNNMREMVLRIMKRMEKKTGKNRLNSVKEVAEDIKYPETQRIVNSIAREYGLEPENTKIMATNTIALIYEEEKDKTKISDLFSMATDENQNNWEQCIQELRKALKQIQKIGKEVNTTELDDSQKQMIRTAILG